jgi:hypothetical protein
MLLTLFAMQEQDTKQPNTERETIRQSEGTRNINKNFQEQPATMMLGPSSREWSPDVRRGAEICYLLLYYIVISLLNVCNSPVVHSKENQNTK